MGNAWPPCIIVFVALALSLLPIGCLFEPSRPADQGSAVTGDNEDDLPGDEEHGDEVPGECPLIRGKSFVSADFLDLDNYCYCWSMVVPCLRELGFWEDDTCWLVISDVVVDGNYTCDGITVRTDFPGIGETQGTADPATGLLTWDGDLYLPSPPDDQAEGLFVQITGVPERLVPCKNVELYAEVTGAQGDVTYEWSLSGGQEGMSLVADAESADHVTIRSEEFFCNSALWVQVTDEAGRVGIARADVFGPLYGHCDGDVEENMDRISSASPGTTVVLDAGGCSAGAEAVAWRQDPNDSVQLIDFTDHEDGTASFVCPSATAEVGERYVSVNLIFTVTFAGGCDVELQIPAYLPASGEPLTP